MNNLSKVSPKFTVIPVLMAIVCSIITLKTLAHDAGGYDFFANLTVFQQIDTTVNPLADTIPLKDTVNNAVSDTLPPRDTSVISVIDTLNLKISQDSLDAVIKYSASDSIVFDRKTNQVILYGKATTEYKDLTLSAEKLIFDQSTQIVTATHMLDTAGMKVGLPQLVQGDQSFTADTIVYNFKTQKGITRNTYTQQGEMFVSSEKVKKISDAEYFMYRGTVTTCNFDIPHFGFVANKMKLVKDKFAITGPVHPEFEGVPIPIYLPFGRLVDESATNLPQALSV